MKSRHAAREKIDARLREITERLAEAQAHVARADDEQTAAQRKLSEIGETLTGLKSKLARLAADRARTR